jgi:hypothetical protein
MCIQEVKPMPDSSELWHKRDGKGLLKELHESGYLYIPGLLSRDVISKAEQRARTHLTPANGV